VSTAAAIAVIWGMVAAISWMLRQSQVSVLVVVLVVSGAILLFYVMNLWVGILTGRLKGKTAQQMGKDALTQIPVVGRLFGDKN
jgi:hypothetical protein